MGLRCEPCRISVAARRAEGNPTGDSCEQAACFQGYILGSQGNVCALQGKFTTKRKRIASKLNGTLRPPPSVPGYASPS